MRDDIVYARDIMVTKSDTPSPVGAYSLRLNRHSKCQKKIQNPILQNTLRVIQALHDGSWDGGKTQYTIII